MRPFIALTICTALATAPAHAASFQFCWNGNNGYTMRGVIGFPDALLGTGIITEADVTEFEIFGYHNDLAIGAWSLDQLRPDTSWVLRFDTDTLSFPTGGDRALGTYQEWNASGSVDDCGAVDGFGWNGGNWAQDVCVNNVWIEDSSIDPYTPLQAYPLDVAVTCETSVPIS